MIHMMLGVFMLAATGAASGIDVAAPGEVRQGEAFAVRLPGNLADVRGSVGDRQLNFFQSPAGWVALVGFDLDASMGAQEITGSALRDGKKTTWKTTVRVLDGDYPVQRITLPDDSQVVLSDENIARSRRESAAVGEVFRLRTERMWDGNFKHPLKTAPEGGRFGHRRIINDHPRNPHSGADYAVPMGTPVMASNHGRVVLADDHFFAGKSIFIDHGEGLVTMYFHLNEKLVEEGQEVRRGDVIGKVGSTGRSTGPHLHFGIRLDGARVDPATLMKLNLE